MVDNKLLPPSGAGSTITTRTKDRTGVDTQIVALDLNPGGAESLMAGSMPVTQAAASSLDGHSANIGALADADTASTLTGLLKKIKALLASVPVTGTFWQATQPVSGTVTATVATRTNKWAAAPTSRGTVLTTELNSLGIGAFSGVGSAFDPTTNLDKFYVVEVAIPSVTTLTGAYLDLYFVKAIGGTNYEDPPSATNAGTHMRVATINVSVGASAKLAASGLFLLPPCKGKFVLYNGTGVAFTATNNTVTLYSQNTASV